MKTNLAKRVLPRMAGIAAALLTTAVSVLAQTSPVGEWDCVISGDQKGVAQLIFNSDFTVTGGEVITLRPAAAPDEDPRAGVPGRDADDTDSKTNTLFFGSGPLTGYWTYNGSGIAGILEEGPRRSDNGTNGISFRGKVSGNRLTLVGTHDGRKFHYRGVPLTAQSNIMGNYLVQGKRDGEPYVELLNLVPDVIQNGYLVTGQGPAYSVVGYALLSGQNQLAIAELQSVGTNGVLSAISGSYNVRKGRGSLTGVDETHDRVTGTITKQ